MKFSVAGRAPNKMPFSQLVVAPSEEEARAAVEQVGYEITSIRRIDGEDPKQSLTPQRPRSAQGRLGWYATGYLMAGWLALLASPVLVFVGVPYPLFLVLLVIGFGFLIIGAIYSAAHGIVFTLEQQRETK
ncbi:hypothetical protein AB1L30_05390 [Bremerella sp. JC817]|uniref:hypothetical protein n=1 Tax=Bremerella sp. JC817 TaxID=3231756 RepID=UPI003459410E